MSILNIAGYKFLELNDLQALHDDMLKQGAELALKGTILLSHEGINLNLAGVGNSINQFRLFLKNDKRFSDMRFHETYSEQQPFRRFKIKLKKEIITLRQSNIYPTDIRAPHISPEEFKQWLDENRDMTILDTRNDYEIRFGTFKNAMNLKLSNFGEFPSATQTLERKKPIVMFCTGGIRCEKAALYLQDQGFAEVYQLDGGILNYFAKVGGAHYEGECFVFDERVAVNAQLDSTHTIQCIVCQGPISLTDQQSPAYIPGISCPACVKA